MVGVMTGYEHDIVRETCIASGLPTSEPKFLPTVGTLKNYLNARATITAKVAHYSALTPAPYRHRKSDPWNLFVPNDAPRYETIVLRAKENPDFVMYEAVHECQDGRIRSGYWVPNAWYEEIKSHRGTTFSGLSE